MSDLRLSGLSTGLDTQAIVDQLLEASSNQLRMYQAKLETQNEKQEALTSLQTRVNGFKSTLSDLSDSSSLKNFNVTSSNESLLTASASSNATEGTHSIQIKQLATAARYVHDGYEYKTDYVGQGKFIFSYNHEEMVIDTTDTTTLDDLVNLINNNPENPGVTAGLLKHNDSYHLVLSGKQSGSDYDVKINTSTTQKLGADFSFEKNSRQATSSTKIVDLDQYTVGTDPSILGTITISGTDQSGTAIADVDLQVTNATTLEQLVDKINQAFDGIATAKISNGEITLTDDNAGTSSTSMALTWTNDPGGDAAMNLPTFTVEEQGGLYNADMIAALDPSTFTSTQTAQDSMIKVDNYPTAADEWIVRSGNTIDDVISGVTLNLQDTSEDPDNPGTYDSIEISMTRNTESLKTKINAMVTEYNAVMTYIKEKTNYDEETGKAGVLISDYTVSNVKNMLRDPFISQAEGFLTEVDAFTHPNQIGLEIESDGMLSFDTTKFDEAIVEDYSAVLDLFGTSNTGSSSNSKFNFYNSSIYTEPGEYDVKVTVSGGSITSAQIRQQGSSTWNDADINNNVVTGSMDTDSEGNRLYPEFGLQFTVDRSTDGIFEGTIRLKSGFAADLEDTIGDLLNANSGRIAARIDGVDLRMESIKKSIEAEQQRLQREEKRLIQRFASLESSLTLMQRQMSALSNM